MKRFKKVYVEITNVCNLSCDFCPKTSRELKFMDIESFEYVVKSVKPYTDHIYFHLMGEPFLNPELESFLAICHSNQIKVNITTNGTLIDKVKYVLLGSNALRKVSFSLHSFEANQNQKDLNQYLDNIIDFVFEAEARKVICELRLWNSNNNVLNSQIISQIEDKIKVEFKEKLELHNDIKIRDYVYVGQAEKFEWPDINLVESNHNVFCYGLKNQLGILVDGTVVPCCLDSEGKIPLGNVFDQSLEEILNGQRTKNIIEGFSRRCAVEELCQKCGYSKRFGA